MSAHTHTASAKGYVYILAALLGLTAVTVAAAGIDFGSSSINVVIALAIATVKASLVALYFMYLRHDKPINAVIFCSSLFFLALFLGFCLVDSETRDHIVPANAKVPAVGAPAAAAPVKVEGHH